jgi:DNA-binding response OmpR family regulator
MARILVIDDDNDVRSLAQDVLRSAGHEVFVAADGAQGIALQRTKPAAVVITDILMPEKEGLETIRDLKHEFPGLKIIAISGAGKRVKSTAYLLTARELGAQALLRKPFNSDALVQTVREVLQSPVEKCL